MSEPNRRGVIFAFDHQLTSMQVFEGVNGYDRKLFHEVEVLRGGRKVKVFIPKDPNFRACVAAGDPPHGCKPA